MGDYSKPFFADSGSEGRIDHRTLKAQAIDREPNPNVGIAFYGHLRALTAHMADRVDRFKAVSWRNQMREQFDQVRRRAPDLTADFIAHAREYAPKLFPELQQEQPDRGLDHER